MLLSVQPAEAQNNREFVDSKRIQDGKLKLASFHLLTPCVSLLVAYIGPKVKRGELASLARSFRGLR